MPFVFGLALALLGGFTALQPLQLPLLAWLAGVYVILWLYGLVVDDTRVSSVLWGPTIAAGAWLGLWLGEGGASPANLLICSLATAWALKTAAISWLSGTESTRIDGLRAAAGSRWPAVALLRVHLPQALLAWVLTAPIVAALGAGWDPSLSPLHWVGLGFWAAGILLQSHGEITRGDRLLAPLRCTLAHWGFGCFAAAAGRAEFLIVPALVTVATYAHEQIRERRARASRPLALAFALSADG
ncbi:MAG: DUF1295 domain-containing protein [Pseudomonadota bacterium]